MEVAVSLQGSLGTVGLPEVLGLIAATAKSGELSVAGNRTDGLARTSAVQGRLWFDTGRLAAADVAGETDLVDGLVELLWLVEGTFTFRSGPAPSGGPSADSAIVLGEALARQAEWHDIAQVVPSRRAWLELNPGPPAGPVTLRPDQWALIIAVAAGNSVAATVARLGLGELPGFRALKEIVEAGLVTVHPEGLPPISEEGPVGGALGIGDERAGATAIAAPRGTARRAADTAQAVPVITLLDRVSP
jgi:hypothetical protein